MLYWCAQSEIGLAGLVACDCGLGFVGLPDGAMGGATVNIGALGSGAPASRSWDAINMLSRKDSRLSFESLVCCVNALKTSRTKDPERYEDKAIEAPTNQNKPRGSTNLVR